MNDAASGFDVGEFLAQFAPETENPSEEERRQATEAALGAAEEVDRMGELAIWLIHRDQSRLREPIVRLETAAEDLMKVTGQNDIVEALDVIDMLGESDLPGSWDASSTQSVAPHVAGGTRARLAAAEFSRSCANMIDAAGADTLGEAADIVDSLFHNMLGFLKDAHG